jgi:twinkle protein
MDGYYRVMPGEITLITGIPGAGKSEWLDALTVNLARNHGWTFGVFSPENQPLEYHADKLIEKYVGKPAEAGPTERMNSLEHEDAMDWLDAHFTFVLPEEPTIDGLLDIGRSLVRRNGIRGMILDPWNEIDHQRPAALTETEYISQSLTRVRKFARENGVHVWIVAHPTKLPKGNDGRYPVPTPYDIAGSAHWRNKADNCITVHRDQVDAGSVVEIHVQKIRKKQNGRIGVVDLQYNRVVGQYACDSNFAPDVPRTPPAKFHHESGE